MSATSPDGASCCTAMADPLPGQFTNRSGAFPPPSCARSAVCSWSVGENDALNVTSGATFLYWANSSSHAALASVIAVSVRVTSPPPVAPLPLPLSWVPDPHAAVAPADAANATATAALRIQRFINALLPFATESGPTADRVATREGVRALEKP